MGENDLYRAAIHEHGHSVVAAHFGAIGDVDVFPNPTPDQFLEKSWVGHFMMYAEPGSVRFSDEDRAKLGIVAPPANWRRLVGLAGAVAELALEVDAAELAEAALDVLGWGEDDMLPDTLSESDQALAAGWTADDLEECASLVTEVFPQIVQRAKWVVARHTGDYT